MSDRHDETSPPRRPDGAAPVGEGDADDVVDPTETDHPTGADQAERNADDEPAA